MEKSDEVKTKALPGGSRPPGPPRFFTYLFSSKTLFFKDFIFQGPFGRDRTGQDGTGRDMTGRPSALSVPRPYALSDFEMRKLFRTKHYIVQVNKLPEESVLHPSSSSFL